MFMWSGLRFGFASCPRRRRRSHQSAYLSRFRSKLCLLCTNKWIMARQPQPTNFIESIFRPQPLVVFHFFAISAHLSSPSASIRFALFYASYSNPNGDLYHFYRSFFSPPQRTRWNPDPSSSYLSLVYGRIEDATMVDVATHLHSLNLHFCIFARIPETFTYNCNFWSSTNGWLGGFARGRHVDGYG